MAGIGPGEMMEGPANLDIPAPSMNRELPQGAPPRSLAPTGSTYNPHQAMRVARHHRVNGRPGHR